MEATKAAKYTLANLVILYFNFYFRHGDSTVNVIKAKLLYLYVLATHSIYVYTYQGSIVRKPKAIEDLVKHVAAVLG
jgi:hypothetical protein